MARRGWDPWATAERLGVPVRYARLDGLAGMWQRDDRGDVIVLDVRLDRRRRRCVLAHELVHMERGIGHGAATGATMEREEAIVEREVARRLVPPAALAALVARRTSAGGLTPAAVAEEFDVDDATARAALAGLDGWRSLTRR